MTKFKNWPTFLTLIWLVTIAFILVSDRSSGDPMKLNAIGDFLAGTMSPLALFWIVIAYYQQNEDLKLTKREMKNQVEETKNLVKQTAKQADIMDKQFNKQNEPLFVFVKDASEGGQEFPPYLGRIFAKNAGGIATDLIGEPFGQQKIQIKFETFETAVDGRTGLQRNVRFEETTFVEKGRQFVIRLLVHFENDDESEKIFTLKISCKDLLGRDFIQLCKFKAVNPETNAFNKQFFSERAKLVERDI